jgi:hypothetical protein
MNRRDYPPAVLVERLATARRHGVAFTQAWPAALAAALAVAPQKWERDAWSKALAATWEAWQASYERTPAERTDHAFVLLDDPERCVPVPEQECARDGCENDIPPGRGNGRPVLYCSDTCRKRASDESTMERRRAQRELAGV